MLKYVHRDIAARNCLGKVLPSDVTAKCSMLSIYNYLFSVMVYTTLQSINFVLQWVLVCESRYLTLDWLAKSMLRTSTNWKGMVFFLFAPWPRSVS